MADLPIEAPDVAGLCKLLLEMAYADPGALMSTLGIDEHEAARFADVLRRLLDHAARLAELGAALPAPDVVVAADIESLIAGVIAKYRHGARLLYDVDTHPANEGDLPEAIAKFWRELEKALLRHVDQGFAASQQIADNMPALSGMQFRMSSELPEALAAVESRADRGPDFGARLLEQVPEWLVPTARAAFEAHIGRYGLIEIKPLRINGAWTSQWNAAASRVNQIQASLVRMIGGTVGLSIELPYPTDVNCLFLSFDGCDPDTLVEVDSWGRSGASAPAQHNLGRDGDLFLPWTGNLASRLNVRMKPAAEGADPRLRSIRIFTASSLSA